MSSISMTDGLPQVSIITPSLNQARFLPQAIESVLRQDYPHLEYIVVDGGSTDGTLEILRSYGDRLRWVSERDAGQSSALNKGFRMARGEIVAWINADDVLLAGAVRRAAAALAADPGLGMVYGEGYMIDEEGCVKCRFPYTAPFDLWRLIHTGDSILQQTAFMRKAALEQVGYVDESLHWGMDWDLFIRLGKRFRVQYLNEYLGCIREYGATKTATGGLRRFRELRRIMSRHAGRRFPPAYFGYGLDAYYSVLASRWPVARRALDKLHAAAGRYAWAYIEEGQGWRPGGWAGPAVHFLFPNLGRVGRLEVEGAVAQMLPKAREQKLAIVLNGKFLRETLLPLGPFHLVEPVPDWAADAEVLRVDLIASGVAATRRYAHCPRPLKVCYLLRHCRLSFDPLPPD